MFFARIALFYDIQQKYRRIFEFSANIQKIKLIALYAAR